MRIAFLGIEYSFSYNNIGGTDSYCRRLALQLVFMGYNVSFIKYGCTQNTTETIQDRFNIFNFTNFKTSLEFIENNVDIVLVNAIHKHDRLVFIKFRKKHKNIRFYYIASVFSESFIKRNLYLLEPLILPYNGGVLGMSPRLVDAAIKRRNRAELLLPPVPYHYYCKPENKTDKKYLNVTYMGRTIPGKGADEAIEIFKGLEYISDIKVAVYGYIWPDDREEKSIHNWLISQNNVQYICEDYHKWSPEVDLKVADRLKNTDILILPYKWLSSTIDMPLLLLEGMAAGCCIITKPLGDIPMIYGNSDFIISPNNFVAKSIDLIKRVNENRHILHTEKKRIYSQTQKYKFDEESISNKLLNIINESWPNN